MVGALGTQWAGWRGHVGLGPRNPPSPSSRSTSSFSLFLSFSFSPWLFYSLSVCLTIPHHDASRTDLPGTRRVDSVSFSPSRRTLGFLSHGALSPVSSVPRERPWRSPNTSSRLCVVPVLFSYPVGSVRPDNRDESSTIVVRATAFRVTYSRS